MNLNKNTYLQGNNVITEVQGKLTSRDVGNLIVFPSWLLDIEISPRAVLLYGLLHSFYHNKKRIFASNEFMAESLHVSERTISTLLQELQSAGLLEVTYKDPERRHRGEIFVIDPYYEAGVKRRENLRLKKTSLQTEENFSLDRRKLLHNNKDNNKNNKSGAESSKEYQKALDKKYPTYSP